MQAWCWAASSTAATYAAVAAALHRETGGDPLRDLTPMMLRSRADGLRRSVHDWLAEHSEAAPGTCRASSAQAPDHPTIRRDAHGDDPIDVATLLAIASVLTRRLFVLDWLLDPSPRSQGARWKVLGAVYPLHCTHEPHRAEWREPPLLLGMRESGLFFEMRRGRRGADFVDARSHADRAVPFPPSEAAFCLGEAATNVPAEVAPTVTRTVRLGVDDRRRPQDGTRSLPPTEAWDRRGEQAAPVARLPLRPQTLLTGGR
jgi:hypothetical protein